MAVEQLGEALTIVYSIPGGEARLYERGLTVNGAGGEVLVLFNFPMIGRPHIVTGDPAATPLFEPGTIQFRVGTWQIEQLIPLLQEALAGRLSLVPTGQTAGHTPLVIGTAEVLDPTLEGVGAGLDGETDQPVYGLSVALGALEERQLYDVTALTTGGAWRIVAPHAVYHRRAWTDFGIAHITDIHVARRIDKFRGLLVAAGRSDAAQQLYNWNDRFRGFVKYANYLHSIGVLDIVIATGDVYDYMFEDDDDPTGGGNAAFLRQLILGQAPGPEFGDVEELLVPLFMTAGNHDYRKHAYKLLADVKVGAGPASRDILRIETFSGYNLLEEDAWRLTYLLDGRPVLSRGPWPVVMEISISDAARMVAIDQEIKPYKTLLSNRGFYIVRLGPHRIAMLDSAYDVGVVTDTIDAIKEKLGYGSEDESTFVGGSPNSEGVSAGELQLVANELAEPSAAGLFIVGIHAPLFNLWNNEYPYFLRETQRPTQPGSVQAFLARHSPAGLNSPKLAPEVHPTWFPGEHDHRAPIFVKRVDSKDLLDFGVSRGEAAAVVRLLAGVGSRRPVDLVLSGHTHHYNEFSVKQMHTGELAFYMDFYTENPSGYYPTRFTRQVQAVGNTFVFNTSVTYVEVVPGAPPNATPWPMPVDAKHTYQLQVPPYPQPLSSAPDPRTWWAERRPLVLQTGALGPREDTEFSFNGFRVLTVKNDVIDKIHFVATDKLERSQYRLAWEDAIRPDPIRSYLYVERSRPFQAPEAVGAPSGLVFATLGVTNVVYRDTDGHLHELWQMGAESGTGNVSAAANNPTAAAGDPRSFIATTDGLLVALYRGTDRHVHSLYWSTGAVGHDALSEVAGAPQAAGNPVGFVQKDGTNVVIYRSEDNHLRSLWWTGTAAPGTENLSAPAGAPEARGDPAPYINQTTGENIIAYRGVDGHIHTLYWTTGAVGHDNLSGYAGSPTAAGDPVAYYTVGDDTHQVTYRSDDGHLHELWWNGNNPVSHWDLTAVAGAPPAASDPAAYYSIGTYTKHVIYRSEDGHVHDIWWVPGRGDPAHVDLTVLALAPLAADKPTAFTVEAANTQHVVYRGVDNHIHEIRWAEQGFARISNHLRPDQVIHIEDGPPQVGALPTGFLSPRWRFELVPGTDQKRIRSVWKPDHYVHIEGGVIECGPVGPGWLSARWLFEPIPGSPLVRLRSSWKPDQCLHIEGGQLECGSIEPGWLSAMWMVEYG